MVDLFSVIICDLYKTALMVVHGEKMVRLRCASGTELIKGIATKEMIRSSSEARTQIRFKETNEKGCTNI